jgi:hypothetical protein
MTACDPGRPLIMRLWPRGDNGPYGPSFGKLPPSSVLALIAAHEGGAPRDLRSVSDTGCYTAGRCPASNFRMRVSAASRSGGIRSRSPRKSFRRSESAEA